MRANWRLQDEHQCLVLSMDQARLPQITYWGAPLPDDVDLDVIARAHVIDVTGGMLDANPDLSICPEASQSFPGQPGLSVLDANGGRLYPSFRFVDAEQGDGTLALTFADKRIGLTYRAEFALDANAKLICAKATLMAVDPVRVAWLSAPVFPVSPHSDDMLDFTGRWCREFQMQRVEWAPGVRMRENLTGRTGHEHFPGLFVPEHGATNTRGTVFGFHYGWSGGHRMIAEELPDGRRQVQFGHAAGSLPEPGTYFETAPLFAVYSNTGFNGCATSYQRFLRDRVVPHRKTFRPVHYNCWEAVYFDHKLPELKDIATRAADLGAERFVLDDGWFGRRDSETTSLGDWQIDPRKYPNGLGPLIDHVQSLGMSFGIWFEPEMANPDSDLLKKHPDWALGGEDQILGRFQKVLDLTNPDVEDYLYQHIAAILTDYPVDYIKWDHNRVLPLPDGRQAEAIYALLARLNSAFPEVEIESCASGGGRIDFGILQYTGRVWLSDSNDALERLYIQHNAALFLPQSITGSHVGPRVCHTSGRILDMRFRAWVAAQRHMGFEMDPRELTDEEATILVDVTRWWKANRDWMMRADILRLDSTDPAVVAEQQQAEDGGRFVVFAAQAEASSQIAPRPLRLTGLDPAAMYRVALRDADKLPRSASRGTSALKSGPLDLSGQYLMNHGLTLPCHFPQSMWVVEGQKL